MVFEDKLFDFLNSKKFILLFLLFFLINIIAELVSNSAYNLYFSLLVFLILFTSFIIWICGGGKRGLFPLLFLLVVTLFPDFSYRLYSPAFTNNYTLNKNFSSPISFYIGRLPVFMAFCFFIIFISILVFAKRKGKLDFFIFPFVLSVIFSICIGLLNIAFGDAAKWFLLSALNPLLIIAIYVIYTYFNIDYVSLISYFFVMLQAKVWTQFFLIGIGRYETYYGAGVRSMYDTAMILTASLFSFSLLLLANKKLKNKVVIVILVANSILCILSFLLSKGRGSVLVAFITILTLCLIFFNQRKQLKKREIKRVVAILIFLFLSFLFFYGKKFGDIEFRALGNSINSMIMWLRGTQTAFNASITVRAVEFKEIINKFNSLPLLYLFGEGYGSHIPLSTHFISTIGKVDISTYSISQILSGKIYSLHNFVSTLLLQSGLFGLFSYLFLSFYLFLKLIRITDRTNSLASFILLLLPGLFYSGLGPIKMSITLGFILAGCSYIFKENPSKK